MQQTKSSSARVEFATSPAQYQHWDLRLEGAVAVQEMDVDEGAGLQPGYDLKRNSYNLGVDIELADAVQRLRFEHPEVGCVVITSTNAEVFCAGANIQMLGQSTHAHKVNFCKFTNETRLAMEDASAHSRQVYLCALNGPASGGGYELALACDYVLLIDDGNAAVALPELPLLGVLPGTGGLTRLTDKRHVRRDRADFFCTTADGLRGERALEWGLVDELLPPSQFDERMRERATEFAAAGGARPEHGIELAPVERRIEGESMRYRHLAVAIDRRARTATFVVSGPTSVPASVEQIHGEGAAFWPLALARELDDAFLHLRFNEGEIGHWLLRSEGDPASVTAIDELLAREGDDWLVRETVSMLRRTLKRLELSARSSTALIEPGSCFGGWLLELALAADRSYMLEGPWDGAEESASIRLSALNLGGLEMSNGLSRLATRFLGQPEAVGALERRTGVDLEAAEAEELGLVTFALDAIDWHDEVRVAIEARASYSPDGLTGLEANLRFPGPETMETKIFGRLSAWQNWVFLRENASGEAGALRRYGTGQQAAFDWQRT